ncbi:MAG: PAS domain-containing protein [Clostridiales bacterium]|nr:PAS domain-containing protein [Clostridiales bacterium]
MDLFPYLKSVLEQDRSAVVLCDLEHTVIYMNPAAGERYAKYGGMALLGRSLMDCHGPQSRIMIEKVVAWFQQDAGHNLIYTFRNEQENKDVYMVALRDEDGKLIGYYEKHEYRDRETMELYDFKP